jgi:sigma-70-like protein
MDGGSPADQMGLSQGRISQIKSQAIAELRQIMAPRISPRFPVCSPNNN